MVFFWRTKFLEWITLNFSFSPFFFFCIFPSTPSPVIPYLLLGTHTVMYPDKQTKHHNFLGAVCTQWTLAKLSSGTSCFFKWFENVGTHLQICISSMLNLQQQLVKWGPGENWRVEVAGPPQGLSTGDMTLNFSLVQGDAWSHLWLSCWHQVCPSCGGASEGSVSIQQSLMLCPFIPMRETVYAGAGAEIHQLSCEQWTTFFLLTLNSDPGKKK